MLAVAEQVDEVGEKWAGAPIETVIQHLIREHRSWRIKDFPMIEYLFDCLDDTHGPTQPACLVSLRRAFYRLRAEMEAHMSREENVLFPAVVDAPHIPKPSFGSVRNPIAMLEEDHSRDEQLLADMRATAHGYQLPETASEDIRILFRKLQALEAAMHAHTRLESSVLFARALRAEQAR